MYRNWINQLDSDWQWQVAKSLNGMYAARMITVSDVPYERNHPAKMGMVGQKSNGRNPQQLILLAAIGFTAVHFSFIHVAVV